MARGGEKARLGDIGQIGLPLGRPQRVRRVPPLGDVGEGDDDALDPVVLGAVGQDAADVPGAAPGFDLPLDRRRGSAAPSRASVRRAPSAASELRSASGRPMSLGMTLNSDLVAGVKKRILRSVSRKSVATSVLYRTFCRSLEVVRCRSSVSWSWLLRAVSSSLSDCNSSFDVSSSSFVDWIFLVDRQRFFVDRLLLFARNLEVADGALQFRSAWPRVPARARRPADDVARRGRAAALLLVLRLVDEADQQQLLAVARDRLDVDAERDRDARCGSSGRRRRRRARSPDWPAGSPSGAWCACPGAPWRADHAWGAPAPRADSDRSVPGNRGTRACG